MFDAVRQFYKELVFLLCCTFQGHCSSNPSLRNLPNISMFLAYLFCWLYGVHSPLCLHMANLVRYDWDAATAANFLRKYGLIGNWSSVFKSSLILLFLNNFYCIISYIPYCYYINQSFHGFKCYWKYISFSISFSVVLNVVEIS